MGAALDFSSINMAEVVATFAHEVKAGLHHVITVIVTVFIVSS
jgi:hypothetical protein